MFPITFSSLGLIALAIVSVAILFKLFGASFRNFVVIVIGVALISFVLMKQTEVTYYTRLILHLFMRVR